MPKQLGNDLADRVLQLVYDLQFVGRSILIPERDTNGNFHWKKDDPDRLHTFEYVPMLALLIERYKPGIESWNQLSELRRAVRFLKAQKLIASVKIDDGEEAEVDAGFRVPVDFALCVPYARPDGAIVGRFGSFVPVKEKRDDLEWRAFRIVERLGLTAESLCSLSGICINGVPIYRVYRKMRADGSGYSFRPCVQIVLDHPAGESGCPPDENVEITGEGIERLRLIPRSSSRGDKGKAKRGRPYIHDPKRDAQWATAWGSGRHGNKEQCAKVLGISVPELEKALGRHRKRNRKNALE